MATRSIVTHRLDVLRLALTGANTRSLLKSDTRIHQPVHACGNQFRRGVGARPVLVLPLRRPVGRGARNRLQSSQPSRPEVIVTIAREA